MAAYMILVYLLFLPISPASLVVFLVWSRNISYGYWYATAQCLAWALEAGQDHGVWGGLSEDERRALKRRNARSRVRTA